MVLAIERYQAKLFGGSVDREGVVDGPSLPRLHQLSDCPACNSRYPKKGDVPMKVMGEIANLLESF